jgi:hypothetical protein
MVQILHPIPNAYLPERRRHLNAAVADLGIVKFSGFVAWFAGVFIHIAYLIEFDNRLLVLFQWGWNYITRKKGARLITDTAKTGE